MCTLRTSWAGSRAHFNPILTGGGGQFDPPVRNPRLPRDRRRSRHAFSWVFSFKSYASFDTKFAKIGPSVARSHDVLYSHVGTKFLPKICILHNYVCVQNTWKLLIFLTLIPLGYFEDLSPLGGGGGGCFGPPPPQISATNGPIDLKIGTVVKQVR